jgi:hypothetical protein
MSRHRSWMCSWRVVGFCRFPGQADSAHKSWLGSGDDPKIQDQLCPDTATVGTLMIRNS